MMEALHFNKRHTPKSHLVMARATHRGGVALPLPSACERVAKARGVGGVLKKIFA